MPLANLGSTVFSNYETAFNRLRNPLLSDTMLLQYQISLLKVMIKRQGEIDRIAQSYKKLDLPFKQPAPDKTVCERLPENLLCILYYPDLFGYDVDKMSGMPPMLTGLDFMMAPATPAPTPAPVAPAPSAPVAAPAPPPVEPEEEKVSSPYQWADIQCAGRACRAVLLDTEKTGRRMTVRMGEKLPDESIVQDISIAGVRVSKKGESLALDPAPATPSAEPGEGFGEIGDMLRASGISTTPSAPPAAMPAANPAQAGGEPSSPFSNEAPATDNGPGAPFANDAATVSSPAPAPAGEPAMLGPTGLF